MATEEKKAKSYREALCQEVSKLLPTSQISSVTQFRNARKEQIINILSTYMETSMASAIPTRMHFILECWQKGENEKGRSWNTISNNMADLAGSQPTSCPIDQIFTEQQIKRRGSGASTSFTLRCLFVIQATAAHWVMLLQAVSWESAGPHPH